MNLDGSDYLLFRVGEDRFGIPVTEVNSVQRTSEIKNIEIFPPNVEIATLQQGLVVTLDLNGALLGAGVKPKMRTLILTRTQEKIIGFEVDEVLDIVKYSKCSEQHLDQVTDSLPFVEGIVSEDSAPVILVNGQKLISFVSKEQSESHISQLSELA